MLKWHRILWIFKKTAWKIVGEQEHEPHLEPSEPQPQAGHDQSGPPDQSGVQRYLIQLKFQMTDMLDMIDRTKIWTIWVGF